METLVQIPNLGAAAHPERGAGDAMQELFRGLAERSADLARQYQGAGPFPYIVIDDFLPDEVASELEADFPNPASPFWQRMPAADQRHKLVSNDESSFPPSIRDFIHCMNGSSALNVLERITGVRDLVADTKLVGGGLHQILTGGHLRVHVDYSHHPGNGLSRRLNVILFLNKNWKQEYGGCFELWDKGVTCCEQKILPLYNRLVIFSTTSTSYHGHPEPLACPPDRSRKSIALYYYSNGRPEEPGPVVEHNTLFRLRPGDRFSVGNFLIRTASSGLFRDLTPPLFYRWLRKGWNGLRPKSKKA